MSYKVDVTQDVKDYRGTLRITVNDQLRAEHWDGGEPEDNYFFRDWKWIKSELEFAYEQGRKDASASNQSPAERYAESNERFGGK